MSITLVTGLWNIGRGNLNEGWSRSYEHYLDRFSELLKVENNLIIFGDKELKDFVFKFRKEENTQFVLKNLDWFKNNEYFDLIQNIRNNPNWFNQVGWLTNSTQAKLEMYNPIVMSKMFLLNDAKILDKFNSEKLFWIDAGLSNTVNMGYFTNDNALEKVDKITDKFLFVCFPYEAHTEVHGFDYNEMKRLTNSEPKLVARGGFFGGSKEYINQLNTLYYNILLMTLKQGYMGTEESLFSILLYQFPDLIDYCEIESNGLVYKFFEDVKNKTIEVKNTKSKKTIKFSSSLDNVGLYVITFNSPKQFETLIDSMLEYDINFISKPKKFLLDNSTDLTTTKHYLELCSQYGFEHIKKNNIGITGGRQFIAEHFNEQDDLDYYFFFEDDMAFVSKDCDVCKNGFNRNIKNLYNTTLQIIKKENFDFLKLNFTEFFGSHTTQWAWYNTPQEFREKHWPNKPNLPITGYDPNPPSLEFKNIKSLNGVPYASGEIYLSNWPIVLSKEGNYKCYIETKFENPYEQTLMSHNFQNLVKGKLNPGLLLITPTEHNRFDFYPAELRKEC